MHHLMPEGRMCPVIKKDQDTFRVFVTDRWGPKTTIKDLGPDTLNLVPDSKNDDP